MPCYRPIDAWPSKEVNRSGKRSMVFNPAASRGGLQSPPQQLPCGKCIGCKLERSRQWAMRCHHEASLHEHNSFLTLTYNDQNLPAGGTLVLEHLQLFMKRLRAQLSYEPDKFLHQNKKVRFFACGEYGDQTGRPHYHVCLFGVDFRDKFVWRTKGDIKYFRTPTLEALWTMGQSETGAVTFESAAYVARYITKKITGPEAANHYDGRKPEFVTMSRRPGIGKAWFEKFRSDVFPHDRVVVRGKQMKPPKYYLSELEKEDPAAHAAIKAERKENVDKETWYNNTPSRRKVRQTIHLEKAKQLKREI